MNPLRPVGTPLEQPKHRLKRVSATESLVEAREMARKKKPRLNVASEARRRARRGVGLPPPERIIPDKQTKPAKHKKTFVDLLNEE